MSIGLTLQSRCFPVSEVSLSVLCLFIMHVCWCALKVILLVCICFFLLILHFPIFWQTISWALWFISGWHYHNTQLQMCCVGCCKQCFWTLGWEQSWGKYWFHAYNFVSIWYDFHCERWTWWKARQCKFSYLF